MTTQVIFHDAAEQEIGEVTSYYGERRGSLGLDFLDELEDSLDRIRQFPEGFPLTYGDVRKKVMHRFPYSIMYAALPDHIWVLAVAHHKRRPLYWLDRLKN